MKNVLLSSLLGLVICNFAYAQNATPNYYKCNNRIGGTWTYGRAPSACDSDVFGEDTFVYHNYGDFVFSDQVGRSQETVDYMSKMHLAINEVLTWYLLERNPKASRAEQDLWREAIFAKLHQESFWSHYRLSTGNKLKHMRGDYGHGHGIGQIDDRWHFVKIEDGIGWDLFENLIYGMEIFYREWVRALSASCVTSPTSITRVRAAYSAYNGGPSQLCRWTNPNHRWARNDTNYYDKLKAKSWSRYIQTGYTLSVDPVCLAKKAGACHVDSDDKLSYSNGDLLKLADNRICVYQDEELSCLESSEDVACMSALYAGVKDEVSSVSEEDIQDYSIKTYDRLQVCQQAQPALVGVGDYIKLKKSINLRKTPGGGRLTTAAINSVAEVLDFFIDDQTNKNTYYKINFQGTIGWIYAGNINSAEAWTGKENNPNDENGLLANAADTIKIVAKYGINQRQTAGGSYIQRIPNGATLIVIDRQIVGSKQVVYYRVQYRGSYGWIYAGAMKPTNYLPNWTVKL